MKLVVNPVPVPQDELDAAPLRSFDVPGPRYTSYPTADRFTQAFGSAQYREALRQRAQGAVVGGAPPLSLYVNIPFCKSWRDCSDVSDFGDFSDFGDCCAGNKSVTQDHCSGRDYLVWLAREIELQRSELGAPQAVLQLHLGGGSPTFLSDDELSGLMGLLRGAFRIQPSAELSIDVDPRTATPLRLRHFASLGFNRVSFGVLDFDPAVQAAVHRVQSYESVNELVAEARALRFEAISADLIVGLPQQTPESFKRTVTQMAALHPTRIALHAHTHACANPPQRVKAQRRINVKALPSARQRVQMLADAIAGFTRQGYIHIGMDHFALPTDALAVARRQGRLHRNLQGYTTQPDCDLIALGVSAIGRVGATYSQNAKTLREYQAALAQGQFPVVRGLALSRDDLLRRSVIMAIVCQGRVDIEAIELAHLVQVRVVFAAELLRLRRLQELGLVQVNEQEIQVTDKGWHCVRAIAMVFDRHLPPAAARQQVARVV